MAGRAEATASRTGSAGSLDVGKLPATHRLITVGEPNPALSLPEWIVFAEDLPYSNLGKVSRKAVVAVILAALQEGNAHDALHA